MALCRYHLGISIPIALLNFLTMSHHHVVPVKTYLFVFFALLLLLALTIAAARIEHGVLNLVVGLFIAAAKAALILMFFMHLRYNTAVIRMAAISGLLWLAILLTLAMSDYVSRCDELSLGHDHLSGRYHAMMHAFHGGRHDR